MNDQNVPSPQERSAFIFLAIGVVGVLADMLGISWGVHLAFHLALIVVGVTLFLTDRSDG